MGVTTTFHTVNFQTGEGIDFLASICVPVLKAFPEQWGWEQLGSKYTSNPLFCLDDQVISGPSDTQLIEATTSDTCICTPVEDDIHVPNIEDKGDFCSLAPKSGYGKAARRVRCRNILK